LTIGDEALGTELKEVGCKYGGPLDGGNRRGLMGVGKGKNPVAGRDGAFGDAMGNQVAECCCLNCNWPDGAETNIG